MDAMNDFLAENCSCDEDGGDEMRTRIISIINDEILRMDKEKDFPGRAIAIQTLHDIKRRIENL